MATILVGAAIARCFFAESRPTRHAVRHQAAKKEPVHRATRVQTGPRVARALPVRLAYDHGVVAMALLLANRNSIAVAILWGKNISWN